MTAVGAANPSRTNVAHPETIPARSSEPFADENVIPADPRKERRQLDQRQRPAQGHESSGDPDRQQRRRVAGVAEREAGRREDPRADHAGDDEEVRGQEPNRRGSTDENSSTGGRLRRGEDLSPVPIDTLNRGVAGTGATSIARPARCAGRIPYGARRARETPGATPRPPPDKVQRGGGGGGGGARPAARIDVEKRRPFFCGVLAIKQGNCSDFAEARRSNAGTRSNRRGIEAGKSMHDPTPLPGGPRYYRPNVVITAAPLMKRFPHEFRRRHVRSVRAPSRCSSRSRPPRRGRQLRKIGPGIILAGTIVGSGS